MVKKTKNQYFNLLLIATLVLSLFVVLETTVNSNFSTNISARTNQTLTSGIQGKILLGPTSPVCTVSCYSPYQADVIVRDTLGNALTSFHSIGDGTFKITLAPGTYILDPQEKTKKPFPYAGQQTASVTANTFTQITIIYDTGLR